MWPIALATPTACPDQRLILWHALRIAVETGVFALPEKKVEETTISARDGDRVTPESGLVDPSGTALVRRSR